MNKKEIEEIMKLDIKKTQTLKDGTEKK